MAELSARGPVAGANGQRDPAAANGDPAAGRAGHGGVATAGSAEQRHAERPDAERDARLDANTQRSWLSSTPRVRRTTPRSPSICTTRKPGSSPRCATSKPAVHRLVRRHTHALPRHGAVLGRRGCAISAQTIRASLLAIATMISMRGFRVSTWPSHEFSRLWPADRSRSLTGPCGPRRRARRPADGCSPPQITIYPWANSSSY